MKNRSFIFSAIFYALLYSHSALGSLTAQLPKDLPEDVKTQEKNTTTTPENIPTVPQETTSDQAQLEQLKALELPTVPTPAQPAAVIQTTIPFNEIPTQEKTPKRDPLVKFNFENEDLVKIINMLASKKGMNIILPQGADAINQKVTFKQSKKIPLSQAMSYLSYFLTLSGYAMYPDGSFFVVTRVDPNVGRVPLELFINVAPADLPHSEQMIRAVYYFANLRVPENTQGIEPLNLMMKDMLSAQGSYIFDPKSNGIIITDKANNIGSIATILTELDSSGSRDVIAVVPLYNSTARTVADLLKNQIIATTTDSRGVIRTDLKAESGIYFSTNTRVVADERTNSIIIMGRETSVERLREFVQEYMDAPADSGRSILHAYDLQYLDADEFAKVLQEIVTSRGPQQGQSQKEPVTGPMQFFEGVRVVAESYRPVQAAKAIAGGTAIEESGTVFQGGNRLIIAARSKDWHRIKSLIQQLDKPQKQVIIEVLIVDLSVTNTKILASQIRNPENLFMTPPGFNFQSAQIIGPILDNPNETTPPTTIAADLLRILLGGTTSLATLETTGPGENGSLILSLNDPNGSVWGVFQLLNSVVQTNLLSHPFIVTLNNMRGEEIITTIRRADGDQSIGEGGISTVKQKDFEATIKVAVTPRISSLDRLNLQVTIEIDDFISANITDFTRQTRRVQTNANMNSGQVLVLGGLTRLETDESESETPILGQVPILGWFFKSKSKATIKNNLGIFICPTIVEPKLREGQKTYTSDKVKYAYTQVGESVTYDNLRDPITRFFFLPGSGKDENILTQYLADSKEGSYNFESRERESLESKKIKNSINEREDEESRALKTMLEPEKNPLLAVNS